MIALSALTLLAIILFCLAGGFSSNLTARMLILLIIAGLVCLISGIVLYPYSELWQKGLSGQAVLAEAEYSRRVKVMEAQATLDSARMLAAADVERARGEAEANNVLAMSLGGPEGRLRYLAIDAMREANTAGNKVIYIATEGGMPITEAGRMAMPGQ